MPLIERQYLQRAAHQGQWAVWQMGQQYQNQLGLERERASGAMTRLVGQQALMAGREEAGRAAKRLAGERERQRFGAIADAAEAAGMDMAGWKPRTNAEWDLKLKMIAAEAKETERVAEEAEEAEETTIFAEAKETAKALYPGAENAGLIDNAEKPNDLNKLILGFREELEKAREDTVDARTAEILTDLQSKPDTVLFTTPDPATPGQPFETRFADLTPAGQQRWARNQAEARVDAEAGRQPGPIGSAEIARGLEDLVTDPTMGDAIQESARALRDRMSRDRAKLKQDVATDEQILALKEVFRRAGVLRGSQEARRFLTSIKLSVPGA